MELAPGLHRIGGDLVAIHLIVTDEGLTLVDAGMPGHWAELETELERIGRSADEIRGVVLTHGDSDHVGIAERLRRDYGAAVYVHEADAARARGEESTKPAWGKVRIGPLARFIGYGLRKRGFTLEHPAEVVPVRAGDVLDLPGSPVLIGLPGHSPGSVAVHVPAVGALFVGDALTTGHVLTGERGPQPAPFTDDPATALESLAAIDHLDARWVIPGHGPALEAAPADVVRAVRERAGALR
ncbi:MBL fold metallo-hydrolase [Agromyces seonyuensis]|uniref:MBL fold metallo-hydrolase n=1 Tax=Agromyces seonyuensis TaxID=2662446 RepID=A0A6I4NZV9_9MICO|nr:MBL fold metallo-hydrolase [Agromyces seonyuensis]MWB97995.1 MBL fold metallo-hydrolase [Agromyces seonyuensis]